jgi:hypothetical protein
MMRPDYIRFCFARRILSMLASNWWNSTRSIWVLNVELLFCVNICRPSKVVCMHKLVGVVVHVVCAEILSILICSL